MNTSAENHHETIAFPAITLSELARKYEALWSLRQAGSGFDKASVRAISAEFPGSLRELDVLPDEQLMARRAHARAACQGEAPEAWLIWLLAYHSEMRVVLEVQRRIGELRSSRKALGMSVQPKPMIEQLMLDPLFEQGFAYTPEQLHSLLCPPGGRLNNVVFGWLAERFGVDAERLEQTLFPRSEAGANHERG
ncbi:MAG TPA: hypothetical protein VFQ61_04570 [Polyangiaceae bacterium]|nr:hypothetical protein [Polyangiaceae bacterium]